MSASDLVVGVLLIIYGIVKLTFGILNFASPHHIKQNIHKMSGIGWLVSLDESVAGKVMTILLVLLSIFTLVHGLSLLNVFSESFNHAMEGMVVQVVFNLLMGIVMTVFFAIVAFTNLKIPKDPTKINTYKLVGFGGGLLFLVTVPLLLVFYKYWKPLRWHGLSLPGAIMLIIVATVITLGFVATYLNTKTKSSSDITNLLMIPLNLI
jgi:hypothetical protein